MDLEVRTAGESEIEALLEVMDEAAAWLQSVGVSEQWPASFSDRPDWVQALRDLTRRRAVFLVWLRDEAIASVVLEEHPYSHPVETLWPDGALEAVLLHKLAVRRSVAGEGVGRWLLQWAAEHTRLRGKSELRLDCWAGNERLKRYYVDAGFEAFGDVELVDSTPGKTRTYSVSRFTMRVS